MQPKKRDGLRRGGRPKNDTPSMVDVHVGARVRLRRTLLGLSQEKLGDAIGLTFQQVQKYERGANRIGASRLFDIARALDVPVQFFFDGMPSEAPVAITPGEPYRAAEASSGPPQSAAELDPMAQRETLDLVRAYYRIPDANIRRKLLEFAKALAGLPPLQGKAS